jgi:hypothetical protein
MLFFSSRASELSIDGATRLHLLEALQDEGFTPLIRRARLSSFEKALEDAERAQEMERAIAAWTETEENSLYVRGDLFYIEEHVFYLIFGGTQDDFAGMRAGIVYGRETIEAERKLEAFCRRVSEALDAASARRVREDSAATAYDWKSRRNVVAIDDYAGQVEDDKGLKRRLALEALEDPEARLLLHRMEEAQATGRSAELFNETENHSVMERLADCGLLKREVLISCRKEGRSLFRLPSVERLTIITASSAVCSECGAALSDERVEELVTLTEMAMELLPESARLGNRLRTVLKEIGVAQRAVRELPASSDGEVLMEVTVSDEPFLFLLRDGDLSSAHAAHALDRLIETEAQHLVVIVTGRIQEEARVRLREDARRITRGADDTELVLIEGMDAAQGELQHAFERAAQRALAAELCELDASLGFSAGHMVAASFRLMQRAGALKVLAESATGM